MKILVGLNNKNILDYLEFTNSFIIGLKDFSINYLEYSKDEINDLKEKYPNIELFVSINKNIFNNELDLLEKNLIMLDKMKVSGILFYDLSILSLWKKNNLKVPLVYAGEHMTTNYNICNFYLNKGCEYAYLSSEITLDEVCEIKNNSKIKLMCFLFGYPEVSFSKRKLLTNYFLHNNLYKEKDWYTISSDDENKYFIKESKLGTRILYGKIMNGIKPFNALKGKIDYAIVSEEGIEHSVFMKALKVYKQLLDEKIGEDEAFNKILELTNSDDTVFYYKKTIYKVKDENKN